MSSLPVTEHLARRGHRACSLRGGMAAWAHAAVARELPPPDGFERLVQLDRPAKGALGYVLVAGGEALVVDPPRHCERHLRAARDAGARVVGVADTHAHADYVSGAARLAAALGVPYHLHRGDAVDPFDLVPACFAFDDLASRDRLPLGDAQVEVRPTPGHTPGSVTLVAGDAALTGDFLFVTSVGRPDLGGRTAEWTRSLWESLEAARGEWPDERRILPAHYASAQERAPGGAVWTTFGELRARNEALRCADEASFARWVEQRVTGCPDGYRRIKMANLGLQPLTDLEADELEVGRNRCALVQ
jgi:glyoxylase-like metal-dependent hydrolase (beta-lactamase superfamily II)